MSSWTSGPPKKILLATDLSPRCDRALDRAAALAAQWQSALIVLHVLESFEPSTLEGGSLPSWRRPPDPADEARNHLLADVSAISDKATVLIGEGDPAESIADVAETERCELIVLGTARNELFGRFTLGRTVDRLLRRARVPLLVVENRPRRAYGHIVVATDFSDSSLHALEAAARFFPDQQLTVFHAYDAPMAGLMGDRAAYRREYRTVVEKDFEAFLLRLDKPPTWQAPHVLIEDGPPATLLRELVRGQEVDLVVVGTQGRSTVLEVFTGSVAKAIMDGVPCDVLVVRKTPAAVGA